MYWKKPIVIVNSHQKSMSHEEALGVSFEEWIFDSILYYS